MLLYPNSGKVVKQARKKYNGFVMKQMKKWFSKREGSTPKISVVMAVYNKPHELKLCLEGYRRQSFQNFELILADDGSSPEIEAISPQELTALIAVS